MLVLPFYPQSLSGVFLVFAWPLASASTEVRTKITVRDVQNPSQTASVELGCRVPGEDAHPVSLMSVAKPYDHNAELTPFLVRKGATRKLLPVPCPPLLVTRPTSIDVMTQVDGTDINVGSFDCRFHAPSPLQREEILAMKSCADAMGAFLFTIQCKLCHDELRVHAILDPLDPPREDLRGSESLNNAPDEWECKCCVTKVPLTFLKQGAPDIFRRYRLKNDAYTPVTFTPLYMRGALRALLDQYVKLIHDRPADEPCFQAFFESHPVVWNFLAPARIYHKPPILAKYKTDFGILTRSKILYLVEIEAPATMLTKRNGGIHANLQHGIDQIRDWRAEVQDHRSAVLDQLHLQPSQVHDVRYILIAGLAKNTPTQGLEKVRRDRSVVDILYCFDELATFLHSTEAALQTL